jgi:hypothetical protein
MLEAMTPEQRDEWIAYRQIVPDPIERLIEVCKRGLALLINAWGGKIEPDDLDPMEHEEPEATGAEVTSRIGAVLGPGITRHGNRNR